MTMNSPKNSSYILIKRIYLERTKEKLICLIFYIQSELRYKRTLRILFSLKIKNCIKEID